MGFTNQERINFNSKVLAATVRDAREDAQWYESRVPYKVKIQPEDILNDLATVPVAANLAAAQANAAAAPAVIQDVSVASAAATGTFNPGVEAVRLTEVPNTSQSTWKAFTVFGDLTSAPLENWIQPQKVPDIGNFYAPSNGYQVRLYEGDPFAGGTQIFPTDGTTGTGAAASVGWIFSYDTGELFVSADFRASITDPHILGFRYIGPTGGAATAAGLNFFKDTTATWNLDVGVPPAVPAIRDNIEYARFQDGDDIAIYQDVIIPTGIDAASPITFQTYWRPVTATVAPNDVVDLEFSYQVNGGGFVAPTTDATSVVGTNTNRQAATFSIPAGTVAAGDTLTLRVSRLGATGADTYTGGGIDFETSYLEQSTPGNLIYFKDITATWSLDVGVPPAVPAIFNNIETARFAGGDDIAIYQDFIPSQQAQFGATYTVTTTWVVTAPAGAQTVDLNLAYQVDGGGFSADIQDVSLDTTIGTIQTVQFTIPASSFGPGDSVSLRLQRLGATGADTFAGSVDLVTASIEQA